MMDQPSRNTKLFQFDCLWWWWSTHKIFSIIFVLVVCLLTATAIYLQLHSMHSKPNYKSKHLNDNSHTNYPLEDPYYMLIQAHIPALCQLLISNQELAKMRKFPLGSPRCRARFGNHSLLHQWIIMGMWSQSHSHACKTLMNDRCDTVEFEPILPLLRKQWPIMFDSYEGLKDPNANMYAGDERFCNRNWAKYGACDPPNQTAIEYYRRALWVKLQYNLDPDPNSQIYELLTKANIVPSNDRAYRVEEWQKALSSKLPKKSFVMNCEQSPWPINQQDRSRLVLTEFIICIRMFSSTNKRRINIFLKDCVYEQHNCIGEFYYLTYDVKFRPNSTQVYQSKQTAQVKKTLSGQ